MRDKPESDYDAMVYLCGPMTGKEIDRAWRTYATTYLHRHNIGVLDPTAIINNDAIGRNGLEYEGELAPTEQARHDKRMVEECDILLGHFPYLPDDRPSIGSFWECGIATQCGKAIAISSHLACVREHLFCRAFANWIGEHIDESLQAVVTCVKSWKELGLP